jgi:hypothetical protein
MAVGFVAVFAGTTNITTECTIIMGVELSGAAAAVTAAIVPDIAVGFSAHRGRFPHPASHTPRIRRHHQGHQRRYGRQKRRGDLAHRPQPARALANRTGAPG